MWAGLIAVTSCCDRVENWAAFVVGVIGALFYYGGCLICESLELDDPVDAVSAALFTGIWSLYAVAIFDFEQGLISSSPSKWNFVGW